MSEALDPAQLWYLGPGGMPVPASAKSLPRGCTYHCREGDARWSTLEGPGRPAGASTAKATTNPAKE